jgi:hypothetical protein
MPAPPSTVDRAGRLLVGESPLGFGAIALRDALRFAATGALIDFDFVAMTELSGFGLNEMHLPH